MNIRVDLNYPINDGTEVIFRSPVDCSEVTGLKVYYPENGLTAAKEFVFADAHGNNVGDIDHLFAENVVVKVILDVTTNMAFVQNADTNAYIEKTFIKKVNGIGPDKNGNVTLGGGGNAGGAEVLNVWVEGNEADHTASEIFAHVDNIRGPVQLQYNDAYYQLLHSDPYCAYFCYINDECIAYVIMVGAEGVIEEYEHNIATAEFVRSEIENALGDISTALDSIIAIQEELIGT